MPGKSSLAPLAGLAMAAIAAGCLVTFSIVASNNVDYPATGPIPRPEVRPGPGDGAVEIPAPGVLAGGGPNSSPDATGPLFAPPGGSEPPVTSPLGESVAVAALADFFGGGPEEDPLVARVPDTGAAGTGPEGDRPAPDPEESPAPARAKPGQGPGKKAARPGGKGPAAGPAGDRDRKSQEGPRVSTGPQGHGKASQAKAKPPRHSSRPHGTPPGRAKAKKGPADPPAAHGGRGSPRKKAGGSASRGGKRHPHGGPPGRSKK